MEPLKGVEKKVLELTFERLLVVEQPTTPMEKDGGMAKRLGS